MRIGRVQTFHCDGGWRPWTFVRVRASCASPSCSNASTCSGLEYDNWDPKALLQIKQSTSTRIASCESLVSTRQYRPFLELQAMDVAIIDVPWNGFGQAVKIGTMAETE